jgi:hypothetical protein
MQILGCTVVAAGFLWLLFRTFQKSQPWGTALFFLPPLALVYALFTLRRAWAPLLVLLVGASVVAAPRGINYYQKRFIDLGPRIKEVEGEKHITLTDWDKTDYSFLEFHPETVVLQMANPDVTDQTLHELQGLTRLRELDLNKSQVTDDGLILLRQLPNLQVLRLRGTRITDEGFREYILPLSSLNEVEVIGTKVTPETLKEWKGKKEGRRSLPKVF